jgi:hypothetical protein
MEFDLILSYPIAREHFGEVDVHPPLGITITYGSDSNTDMTG